MDPRDHVDLKNLRDLSWLSIPDRVTYFKMMHLFRVRNKLAPSYLLPNFRFISEIHSHNTRGSSCNLQLSGDLASSPNGFAFTSIKLWNNLPNSLKSLNEFRVFKRRLKLYLISQYEWFYLDFNRTRILVLYLFTVLDYDIWHILFRMIYIFRGPFWKKVTVIDFHWLSLKASFLQLPRVVIYVCFWN